MIVVGFGGNIGGDDAITQRFVRAREALAQLGPVRSAGLYRTAPIGPAQPDYLNTAVGIAVEDITPGELIATVLEIERLLGRDRRNEPRWGPRTLDLDVLLWDARVIRTPELEVPHPRVHERRFALQPLVDVVGPDAHLPGHSAAIGALLDRVREQPLELVSSSW
jgi:2-amino-4-hydroxy-6-hydroxymethyldihydropteridine diphosphokinase